MAKTTAWMTFATVRSPHEAATMTSTILAYLLQYKSDGEYCADPLTIKAQVVEDESYGVVLESYSPGATSALNSMLHLGSRGFTPPFDKPRYLCGIY
jgi:hypothetical protein